jgi:hypothetical protein
MCSESPTAADVPWLMRISQMSHPNHSSDRIVMVLGVNLVCPAEPRAAQFWGKTEGL